MCVREYARVSVMYVMHVCPVFVHMHDVFCDDCRVCGCVTDKAQDSVPVCRVRAPSLAETEEALAHAVWSWAGVSR